MAGSVSHIRSKSRFTDIYGKFWLLFQYSISM